jgi:hypothetical protein
MRYRGQNGQDRADIIDFLTMYPDARPMASALLGELEADRIGRVSRRVTVRPF